MADVMPYVVKADGCLWQMLLPYDIVADGKPNRGRCYNLLLSKVPDVIVIMLCVADNKPTMLTACYNFC